MKEQKFLENYLEILRWNVITYLVPTYLRHKSTYVFLCLLNVSHFTQNTYVVEYVDRRVGHLWKRIKTNTPSYTSGTHVNTFTWLSPFHWQWWKNENGKNSSSVIIAKRNSWIFTKHFLLLVIVVVTSLHHSCLLSICCW